MVKRWMIYAGVGFIALIVLMFSLSIVTAATTDPESLAALIEAISGNVEAMRVWLELYYCSEGISVLC